MAIIIGMFIYSLISFACPLFFVFYFYFFYFFSMEELTSTAGGGPLPIVLSLMLSSQAGLELTTHQDLLQLAGNMVAGQLFQIVIFYQTNRARANFYHSRISFLMFY